MYEMGKIQIDIAKKSKSVGNSKILRVVPRWCKTFCILYFFTQINRSVNLVDKSQLFTPCQKDLAQALLKNAINNLPNHEDKREDVAK